MALAGLALAFAESLELGTDDLAWAGALALVAAPLGPAIGNVAQKLRARKLDALVLNGWAMVGGGPAPTGRVRPAEDWGEAEWGPKALGSIAYLAIFGSAVAFVSLTVLLRHLTAQAMSFMAMLLPFGALLFGAAVYSEPLTARAAGGALLVAVGLMVAQGMGPVRLAARTKARAAEPG